MYFTFTGEIKFPEKRSLLICLIVRVNLNYQLESSTKFKGAYINKYIYMRYKYRKTIVNIVLTSDCFNSMGLIKCNINDYYCRIYSISIYFSRGKVDKSDEMWLKIEEIRIQHKTTSFN